MSNSDHDDAPRTDIFELLPDVYRSDTNRAVLETSFDRILTKDDTTHVNGYVGQPNPTSLTSRQLPETTPQQQAFQLQPTIYSKVGTVQTAMSFKAFQTQLELLGVDFSRMQLWGNAIEFNWVPPVNIDMLVNFADYYWSPQSPTDAPQYFTIENRCQKQQNVLDAYDNLVATNGDLFPIVGIDVVNNTVTINGRYDAVFLAGFRIWIKGTTDVNIRNRFFLVESSAFSLTTRTTAVVSVNPTSRLWVIAGDFRTVLPVGASFTISGNTGGGDGTYTVVSTSFSASNTSILVSEDIPLTATNDGTATIPIVGCTTDTLPAQTIIKFDETQSPMAIRSPTAPPPSVVGRYWVNTTTNVVSCWSGSAWVVCTPIASGVLSLEELHDIIRADRNCACSGDVGWDLALWDDNPPGWQSFLAPFTQPTEAAWILMNGAPTAGALWLDSTNDILYQYSVPPFTSPAAFVVVITDWSVFVQNKLVGDILWDLTTSCFSALQTPNQWTQQNQWIHRSQVHSFAGVRRAQVPIIEFDSRTELNKWTKQSYKWKYRATSSGAFSASTSVPTRLELEPVKGFLAEKIGSNWYLYLFDNRQTQAKDADYTRIFVPGFSFIVQGDIPLANNSYTVDNSVYREERPSDGAANQGQYMVTIVKLVETGPTVDAFFTANPSGGGAIRLRLEPKTTSLGDTWRGYSAHWVLDASSQSSSPAGATVENPVLRRAIDLGSPFSFTGMPTIGPTIVGQYFQESTITGVGVTTVYLDASFQFSPQTVFTVTGVIQGPGGTWTVVGNHASFFTPGMLITIPDNTGGGDGIFTVVSAINNGANTDIVVSETIPASANASGTIATGRHLFALADQSQIRVFVNDIEQYGSYTEQSATGVPDYTEVGSTAYTTQSFNYVTSIVFNTPIKQYSIVRIEVGPAALSDMGLQYVPVRTTEDETLFFSQVLAGTQPVYLGLETYQRNEQNKKLVNQYPLFNVYGACSGDIIKASPIFQFKEDPTEPIDNNTQRRIISTDGGRDFEFEQTLLQQDDGQIYAYRLLDGRAQPGDFWYNPSTGLLKMWDGAAWETEFVSRDSSNRLETHVPFVGITPPAYLIGIANSIWYEPVQQIVQRSNGSVWVTIATPKVDDTLTTPVVFIEGGDPTLTTIWRTVPQYTDGTSGPPSGWTGGTYIPQWVNGQRVVEPVGTPGADWEIPDQWRFNAEHHNRADVFYSDIVTHFRSIIAQQPNPNGFPGSGVSSLLQSQYDYSLGGTMKEHNDSYDTLISAVNVNNTTPIGVIEFAQDQYAELLLSIKELFVKNLIPLLSNTSTAAITDLTGFISDTIIDQFEENDFYGQVFADTSAFDPNSGLGVRNWISTVPMFALGQKFLPELNIDARLGIYEILHHDGHRSTVDMTAAEQDSFSRILVALPDTRVTSGSLGVLADTTPPCFMSTLPVILPGSCPNTTFVAQFGIIRGGVYWYHFTSPRVLYRFDVIAVAPTAPPSIGVPVGALYWDTTFNQLFRWNGIAWVPAAPVGEISVAWTPVDMRALLAATILEIENQLYDVTPTITQLAFDFASLTPTPAEQVVYDSYKRDQFFAFIAQEKIRAPLENIFYNPSDPFTWNYKNCFLTTPPTLAILPGLASSWQQLYTLWYGTPYPHLEPWKLQQYIDKPSWWDATYKNDNPLIWGARRWKYIHATTTGMWENIRIGMVPAGELLPDGITVSTGAPAEVRTYQYFSVNIGDVILPGNYAPDDLFPPYYNTSDIEVRAFFTNLNAEIVAPAANYMYGDGGPTEWEWLVSITSVYDPLVIAFRMQPVRFLHYAFGVDFIRLNNLQIETTLCEVYSHRDALFHGDLFNTDQTYLARGLNQWYVNFNRFVGFDTNTEFRILWTAWDPLLSYKFTGIINTSTLEITNKYFDVVTQDYNIVLANMGTIKDLWDDVFEVVVLGIPPAVIQYNSESQWKFELDTLASVTRDITYYEPKRYPFVINTQLNLATIFQYKIIGALAVSKQFDINGDHVNDFVIGSTFDVINSVNNNGTYTIALAAYDPSLDQTRISVVETVPSSVVDGIVEFTDRVLPWNTGDVVFVTSSRLLPAPLSAGQAVYVIRVNDRQFRIALSPTDAEAPIPIVWTTPGTGDLNVGQVQSSFQVFGGASVSTDIWYHYAVDKTRVRTFIPPLTIAGMQRLISILDGYVAYQQDQGLGYNLTTILELDPSTGRTVSWQLEEERFIDWAYRLRRTRISLGDRYPFVVSDFINSQFQFTGQVPVWAVGTKIVLTTTGTLPSPLIAGTAYYYTPTATPGVFQLSTTLNLASSIVSISSTGSGTMSIAAYRQPDSFPSFEINPARNNIWINTPQGLLSNIIQGPYADIRIQQTIFDQYARPLTPDKLLIFREDKQTRVAVRSDIPNDTVPPALASIDPYNFIHMGGAHFFVEGYEHIVLFNDYTVGNQLIQDQFLGLTTQRFGLDFYEKKDNTLRPTLGGFYLLNQQFYRNVEGQTVDAQNYYDTYQLQEDTKVGRASRALLAYSPHSEPFLDLLNTNQKTQFIFYRGMIHAKGSINSITAYINSRRFVDAKVDDFWAYKVAEFGDARAKVYPSIKLFATDGLVDDIRLEFLTNTEASDTALITADEKNGFNIVTFIDQSRWLDEPDQKELLDNSILFLDSKIATMTKVFASPTAPIAGQDTVDLWYNTITQQILLWNGGTTGSAFDWDVSTGTGIQITTVATDVYVHIPGVIADDFRATRRTLTSAGDLRYYTTSFFDEGTGVDEYSRINSQVIHFNKGGFTDVILIFTIVPAKSKNSPAKIIDYVAQTVVSEVPMWDPARGNHSPTAIHNVDLQAAVDPALYTNTLNPDDVSQRPWDQTENDTVWLDTSTLAYLPYYDDIVIPDINQRLYKWGRLADWGVVRVFQWIETQMTPTEYAGAVSNQANDTTLASADKVTGTPRSTTFRRDRTPLVATITGPFNTSTVNATNTFSPGDVVFVQTTGTMPATTTDVLVAGTKYFVTSSTSTTVEIGPAFPGASFLFTNGGTGIFTLIPAFKPEAWKTQPVVSQQIIPIVDGYTLPIPPVFTLSTDVFSVNDVVNMYNNGVQITTGQVVDSLLQITNTASFTVNDIITVVRPIPTLTATQLAFDPDTADDGTVNTQYKQMTEYTVRPIQNSDGTPGVLYYFWVENGLNTDPTDASTLPPIQIEQQLTSIPTPYLVVQRPEDDPTLADRFGFGITFGITYSAPWIYDQYPVIPVFYRQAIVRRAADFVNADNRYVVRFTRDLTLRDSLDDGVTPVNLKDKHQEWVMIRREQPANIPRVLWDRLTEALIGYRLVDPSIRVPSLERELYDATFGTDQRFGLGPDQAFTYGPLSLSTILAYLNDPANNFAPVDINVFFDTYTFDTPANIAVAMDAIFNSFSAQHVNNMWFNTLLDAFSVKAKYREIFKTSWVALHGIRVLEVGGLFDD